MKKKIMTDIHSINHPYSHYICLRNPHFIRDDKRPLGKQYFVKAPSQPVHTLPCFVYLVVNTIPNPLASACDTDRYNCWAGGLSMSPLCGFPKASRLTLWIPPRFQFVIEIHSDSYIHGNWIPWTHTLIQLRALWFALCKQLEISSLYNNLYLYLLGNNFEI